MGLPIDERVRRYLRAIGTAVAGSGESHKTVLSACLAGHDFGVDLDAFMPLLEEWNSSNSPPLPDRELRTQVSSAYRSARSVFGHKRDAGDTDQLDAPPRPPPAPPEYPPQDEVARLWEQSMPIDEHPQAAAWAASRGLDLGRLSTPREFPIARALRKFVTGVVVGASGLTVTQDRPTPLTLPRWASIGSPPPQRPRSWADTGYQVIIPCFDAAGTMRSFRARWIESEAPPLGKAIPPSGYEARGLVMANLPGLWLLRFGKWPDTATTRNRQLWIVEGEPDTLTIADLIRTTKDDQRAVWGLYNGSWTAELAARVPGDTDVVLGIHDDPAGRVYTDKVDRSLHGRVCLRQHRPKRPREE